MLWTGMIVAALMVAQAAPSQQHDGPATPVAPISVVGPRMETGANTRASDPSQEVICRNAPVTGSRFNQRRCRTRQQAAIAAAEARSTTAALQGSGPTTDAALSSGPAPIGP